MDLPDYAYLDELGAAQVFFPRSDFRPAPPGAEDHEITLPDGITLGARFYAQQTSHPTVLYFHGNGEVAADHDDIAGLYHDIGLNLLVVEFRGYGRSSGSPGFARMIGDVAPIVAWFHSLLDERGFEPNRLVMGRSLGAYSALEVAANFAEGFNGLVIESGASSVHRMVQRLGATDDTRAVAVASAHDLLVQTIRQRTLIIHGEMDDLVPPSMATRLQAALGTYCQELLMIPHAGHNDLLWLGREMYFHAIARHAFPSADRAIVF